MKLAVVASHPIQYHSPWYRALASQVNLQVFYAHKLSPQDHAAAGFQVPFEWDVPLLEGYPFFWLKNRARRPGVLHFWGCNTPSIRDVLQRGKFDAILVQGWHLLCYWQTVWAAKRCELPIMVRGDSHSATPRSLWKRWMKRLLYPRMLQRFDAFLSVGQRHSEYLEEYGVPAQKIFHVPHFVDNDFFRVSAEKARQIPGGLRSRFGIPKDKIVFLFVGKFISPKRPLDFLLAIDELQRQGVNAWGFLIGDGPMRPLLERHTREQGTPCSFAGFLNQSEMGFAYGAADALVLPSESETWGLTVNEAMASGIPAIASDRVGCVPDLIVDGKTGFSYPYGKIDELVRHMARMVEDPGLLRSLSAGAVAHVQAFSLEAGCAGLLEALDFVGGERKRPDEPA